VLHDLRQHFGPSFNPARISKGLAATGLLVASVSQEHAEELAARLGRRFPDGDSWRAHKLEIAASCLGIAGRLGELGIVPPATSRCGATVDWLIGSHAVQESAILVTNDRQIEFEDVPTLSRDALAAALDELLGSG
jgi:predicted nucleic acid-binding protein